MDTFFALRDAPGLKKKPSTSEFLDWLRLLVNEAVSAKDISSTAGDLPLMAGALLKNEQDLTLLQRLAAMPRAGQRRCYALLLRPTKIGSASCRERVCTYVSISVVAVSLKKKN